MLNHADRAYLTIRDRILSGQYPVGYCVIAREASGEFGGSQETISRVLVTLSSEGYLDEGARSRGSVRAWPTQRLDLAFTLRQQILLFAAQECSAKRNPLAMARLKAILEVLASHANNLTDSDGIADCLSLFDTELCNGVGLEGLASALRNIFPPILIRMSALAVDELGLRRRLNAYAKLVESIEAGAFDEQEVRRTFEPDAMDANAREVLARAQAGVKSPDNSDEIRLFSSRETTYDRWAADVRTYRQDGSK